jgi:hypothetical protein
MWRYLLPAILVMSALLVLFAGALGDIGSWPHLQNMLMSVVQGPVDQPSPVAPKSPASVELPAKPSDPATQTAPDAAALRQSRDALQTQVDNLQQDVAQQRQELASLHATEDQERRALDGLRKQRHDVEAAPARSTSPRQYSSTASPVVQPTQRESASPAPQSGSSMRQQPSASPREQLSTARQAVMDGRPADAQHMLSLAQTGMVFQPVTPDQPNATGGNMAATEVGYAIRWLELGNSQMALQQIDAVLATMPATDTTGTPPTVAPTPLASGYTFPRPSTANVGSGWR